MCDYSLNEYHNRLANVGENLVAHSFETGSIGFIAVGAPTGEDVVCAICIPPGSKLKLSNISEDIQKRRDVGPEEEVTFVQISMNVNSHRDAVQFKNGAKVKLQDFTNERANVLSLGEVEEDGADPRAAQTEMNESEAVLVGAGPQPETYGNVRQRIRGLGERILRQLS